MKHILTTSSPSHPNLNPQLNNQSVTIHIVLISTAVELFPVHALSNSNTIAYPHAQPDSPYPFSPSAYLTHLQVLPSASRSSLAKYSATSNSSLTGNLCKPAPLPKFTISASCA
jgi:hypothetical protein